MVKNLFILVFLLALLGCEKQVKLYQFTGNAFGSTYGIQYYGKEDYSVEIDSLLKAFDQSVSTYRDDALLAKFNHSPKGIKADSVLTTMWNQCLIYHEKTDDSFDSTVEPLLNLWGFRSEKRKLPNQEQIDSVMAFVGMDKVIFRNDSLIKTHPNVQLSFNSVTGYMNDWLAKLFDQKKIDSYLIEIGGEIVAKGLKPSGEPWRIGIDNPSEKVDEQGVKLKLELKNIALATSGNYRKFYIDSLSGRKIVHTMNSKTGEPEISALLSATVLAKTCAEADATATALMAMGLDKAKDYVKTRPDLKFYLIRADENGIFQSDFYNGFEEYVIN